MQNLQVLAAVLALGSTAHGANVKPSTPIMGWNSYNYYNCHPTEKIIRDNAQGLVSTGLAKLGYTWVTTDCGWNSATRDSSGQMSWNASTFPSGGKALGDYIHNLGLKFGVYSGGGYFQCGDANKLVASLNHETTDANTFASWGADSLKYDNCYSVSPDNMVDYSSAGAVSPTRFQTMAKAIAAAPRNMVFQVCQWGVGENIGSWASAIAGSFRISNDIQNNWKSIWRITNEVIPYYKYTKPGAYPDMDMLIVGLKVLSTEEERFHFGMWAIHKSPLVLGSPATGSVTPASSLAIVSNTEVIAINQDSLGQQAQLIRRYTEEQWDIFAGNLSGSRMVIGLANWNSGSTPVSVNLASILGISSATARDVWAGQDLGTISGTYTKTLAGHQLQLLVLSNIVKSTVAPKSAGYYSVAKAALSGSAARTSCSSTQCLPVQAKVGQIGQGPSAASVTFSSVKSSTSGTKLVGVDYINYDVALGSAWDNGANVRDMTISVNGGTPKRWSFPISGGNWFETGRLQIEVGGFRAGDNTVVFRAATSGQYAPDLVGFEVFDAAS